MATDDQFTPSVLAVAAASDGHGVIGEAENEYGTPVSVIRCTTCGQVITVCPAVAPARRDQWTDCLDDTCESYDVTRDIGIFWDALEDNDLIGRTDPNGN